MTRALAMATAALVEFGQIGGVASTVRTKKGWRMFEAAFISKLNDAEGEAAETQTWIRLACECGYLTEKDGRDLHEIYDHIIGKLVKRIPSAPLHPCPSAQEGSPADPRDARNGGRG